MSRVFTATELRVAWPRAFVPCSGRLRAVGLCAVWILALMGCGDASTGTAPVLENLTLYPAPLNAPTGESLIRGTVQFQDPDGDVVAIQGHIIRADGGAVRLPAQPVLNSDSLVRGTLDLTFTAADLADQPLTVEIWASDACGNTSNLVSGSVALASRTASGERLAAFKFVFIEHNRHL